MRKDACCLGQRLSRVATLHSVEFVCYGLTYTTISKVIALWSNALVSAFLVTDPFETSVDRGSHDQIRPFARDLPHSLAVGRELYEAVL